MDLKTKDEPFYKIYCDPEEEPFFLNLLTHSLSCLPSSFLYDPFTFVEKTSIWSYRPSKSTNLIHLCGIWPAAVISSADLQHFCLKFLKQKVIISSALNVSFNLSNAFCQQAKTFCRLAINCESEDDFSKVLEKLKIFSLTTSHCDLLNRLFQIASNPLHLENLNRISIFHNHLEDLLLSLPNEWSSSVANKIYSLLAHVNRSFFYQREDRHILKIACLMAHDQYQMLNLNSDTVSTNPTRSCQVHYHKGLIKHGQISTYVHGFLITLSSLSSDEFLEERHLLAALREIGFEVNHAYLYTSFIDPESNFYHLYCEIAHSSYAKLNRSSADRLVYLLKIQLLERIEKKLAKVFLPRNEEDSFKLAITLSHEVNKIFDLPQIILNYEDQSDDKLYFRLIIARPFKEDLFSKNQTCLYEDKIVILHQERYRTIAGETFAKQLVIIRAEVVKTNFLREDYSIDLHQARQMLLRKLKYLIGTFRDYNGGLISKQKEALDHLLQWIELPHPRDQSIVEEMFYAIKPAVALSNIDVQTLSRLFAQLLKTHKNLNTSPEKPIIFQSQNNNNIYITATCNHLKSLEELQNHLLNLETSLGNCFCGLISRAPRFLLAFILKNENITSKKELTKILKTFEK